MSEALAPVKTIDPDLAVKSLVRDSDWMQKTGMGGVLSAAFLLTLMLNVQQILYLPVALAILGLVYGYILRTMRVRAKDPQSSLPEWNNWMDLWISGITWISVVFGWYVLTAIVVGTISLMAYAIYTRTGQFVLIAEIAFFAIFFVMVFMRCLLSYLMVNFGIEERLGAGFAVFTVIQRAARRPAEFGVALILAVCLQVLAVILPTLTVIGVFIVPSTFFAAELIGASLLTQAWRCADE